MSISSYPGSTLPDPTVLIIDDHDLVATSLAMSLRMAGLQARQHAARSRAGVLAATAQLPPGVVLLDLDLGVEPDGTLIDGTALIERFLATGWRVLVLSGTADEVRIGKALAAGALAGIPKSAALAVLVTAVRRAAQGLEVMHPERRRQFIEHADKEGRDWSDHLVMYTYTSMRWSELYRPTAADIDGDQLFIPGTKTDESARWISMHPEVQTIVRRRASERPRGPLFVMTSPNPKAEHRAWYAALKRACARVGIEHVTTNDLRRTFCSWCFQQGVPMELVIKWMGHTSSKMVMEVYAQPSAEQGRREIGKLPGHPAVTPSGEKPGDDR